MNFANGSRAVLAALMLTAATVSGALAADKVTGVSEKPVPAAEAPADAVVVDIAKMKYQQPEVTIKAGQTVVWINKEVMPHNVAFEPGVVSEKALKGAMMKKDQAFAVTFTEAGTYDYHCTPHPFMRGKVIVE